MNENKEQNEGGVLYFYIFIALQGKDKNKIDFLKIVVG